MKKSNDPLILIIQVAVLILCTWSMTFSQALDTSAIPKFSVKRGFYTANFDVIVDAETTNTKIFYTLDGSDPRTSATAQQKNSPATIHVDPASTEGQRAKAPGFVIRACSQVTGLPKSQSVTHTYLFVDKAASLSPKGTKPGPNWPDPGYYPQFINYGMNATVLNDSRYKDLIDNALLAIPSISLSTDLKNLFALDSGIYMNALSDGAAWERPASIELINPDGSDGFQINSGLRIRGGYSRHPENPKHAFRLFFRDEYGEGKLKYNLFGDEGVDEFDKVDLRTSQNYSWSYPGHLGEVNTMTRDVFSRDIQREIGQPYTRSRYYHLYINGVYWGIFQSQERSEARYAVSYFGGIIEDYDVIKNDEGSVSATDGTMSAYTEMWNMVKSKANISVNYFKLQGLNTDGTKNPSYKNLLDVDNLIDYMMIIFFAGNFDSPISKFVGDQMPNNFYCIYNKTKNDGFKFFAHDAEHTLRTTSGEGPGIGVNENRVEVRKNDSTYVSSVSQFQPQYLHDRLAKSVEYRNRFADHVYKQFFNQGCMTPEKATALFVSRTKEIEMAIIGESARWGDTYSSPPRTKDDDWQWAVDDIINNYFPVRTGIVLNQLKTAGLYPNINPPIFKQNSDTIKTNSVKISSGYVLKLVNSNGTTGAIKYTLDGSDPRVTGGGVSVTAVDGGDAVNITVDTTTILKTRILNGTTWSALHEIILFADENIHDLKLTEIHYHPLDNDTISGNEYEFIELKNIGTAPINLSQANFIDGITYTFPNNAIINPHEFLVLASNKQEFNIRYKFLPFGEYSGQLDNSGERITLVTVTGDTIFSIQYNDKSPWPVEADTAGYSLVTKETNPTGDLNDAANWRASLQIHGSPGSDDISTSVPENSLHIPTEFQLFQNYPNPFNPNTTISYSLPIQSVVNLKVFDIIGREVAVLQQNERMTAGYHEVAFDAGRLSSGIYFYRLSTNKFVQTMKMVLLK